MPQTDKKDKKHPDVPGPVKYAQNGKNKAGDFTDGPVFGTE